MSGKTFEIYDTLVIDAVAASRGAFKQTALAAHNFGKIHNSVSLKDALQQLGTGIACSLIFVSSRFEKERIIEFIAKAKHSKAGTDAAFILVLKASEGDCSRLAEYIKGGVDGFLFEPYSTDGLREAAEIASKLRQKTTDSREIAAIQLIVADVMAALTNLTLMRTARRDTTNAIQKLREVSQPIRLLSDKAREIYFDLMLEMFDKSMGPKERLFAGISQCAKKHAAEIETAEKISNPLIKN